ncbi:PaaD-like protein (DUF59) involved in Fe-S cluster assembly [Euzebya pacifica]|jgi:metal-sulfur cluster biosynthetic enzyme|uniref:PaaD-like protein (DUF59) involved in Fe-S cluster assembly n=1 Tax=Euzebya pacifica TaxID=1608957 RepID=A0A346Y020_9ACTN|nr:MULTISPECIES: metal-sulfur cluster assembly factor [Euzebya]AXV07817.1 PaaD-like protein (DUF59) involved in Fe-S cluster assembly [Euzebya pacifica]
MSTTDPITGWPTEDTDEAFEARQDGSENPFSDAEVDENGVATPAACREAMKAVLDPEIGLNVVDLGLVYEIVVNDNTAHMRMTLTSMGCPLTELIHQQATLVLTRLPGIDDAEVEFVFSPPWTTDMIDPDAKEELRAMGFNV